jgi:poly(3-hydroxybutyrate) depolymerase
MLIRKGLIAASFAGISWSAQAAASDGISYQGNFPASTPSGLSTSTLTVGGARRDLLLYRPNGAAAQPVLILFSGTGGTLANNIANDMGYETLRNFADQQNVIVVVPISRVISIGDWDNHSAGTPYWETAVGEPTSSAASINPDTNPDLMFVRAIIQETSRAYGADLARVYVNGFSNGAFFSYLVASTLSKRIAAFAQTGGGLVLGNTTSGDPTPCNLRGTATASGSVRTCAAAGWTPGVCTAAGAIARPLATSLAVRVPPGFMEANDDDDTVSFANTCNLAQALPASASYQVRVVHAGTGHAINDDFLMNSWNFMKNFTLTDSDRVFNWAESLYPSLFAPAAPASQQALGYFYRFYSGTNSYIGTKDGRGYYLVPGGDITDAGVLSTYLDAASLAGY